MPAATATLPPLIRRLLDPARTPLPAPVELIETHASWVLLAGEFAWKIKKPLVLPFLDYGTVERRRACCEAELRLNRRLAPQLYLDVVEFDGEPAVKMHRFDEAARLDHVCKRGALTPLHLSGLAAMLASFHAGAAVAPAPTFFGTPAHVLAAAVENFTELSDMACGRFAAELTRLKAWTRSEFSRLEPAFAARKAAGRVRECHGDLHLGNMVLLDDVVVPFDGIEFNDDFRWIDVASEIAFVLVDLLDHGRPGLACWLLNEWLVASGDFAALPLLRFYMAYRALVRAKVAAIRACQQAAGVAADCPEVRDYLALAQRIAVPPARPAGSRPKEVQSTLGVPTFCITHGLAGCGKTTASNARLLADPQAATVRLRSDVERKRLFGLAAGVASGSALDGGIYTLEANARTYARLAELAEAALADGWSVIVDAAFLKRGERDAFRALAARHGVVMEILAPQSPPAELVRRIAARHGTGDASEATVAVLERQRGYLEPLGADEPAVSA
ncbi:MAG: AAA family ATPase [Gammaproteobacteria bacterium]|nr:AAA family ATPase [Gammaproteobacteria bacterium]MBU1644887.1 AAA family ATPase [Gammaproteobacteria bacterium]MBU1971346.1 AAA family ATPase [Gammaproteobacteria bacterium]